MARKHQDLVRAFGKIRNMNDDEREPEVLSYRAFQDRQLLLAWEQRRRIYERAGMVQMLEEDRVASGFGWIRGIVGRLSEGRATRD